MAELDFDKIESTIRNSMEGLERVLNNLSASGTRIADSAKRAVKQESYLRNNPRRVVPKLYKDTASEESKAAVKTILGAGLTAAGSIFSVSTIGMLLAGAPVFSVLGSAILGGLLLASGLSSFFKGRKNKKLIEHFKAYVEIMKGKTVMSVDELSRRTGWDRKTVLSDLKELIRQRFFAQGHMDQEEKELITSDDTYKNYLLLMERQKELEIFRQGEQYLEKIQAMNAQLPGIVITTKLQRLERVIRSILYEVKQQPGSATDLRKLMNYYLPTIWKLLETYKEIDEEPVVTEQMTKTQKEIEQTIDTINNAFENLLEQLFRNKAWDVSSDISVLNTMLAQDGIKDSGFNMNAKKEEVQ